MYWYPSTNAVVYEQGTRTGTLLNAPFVQAYGHQGMLGVEFLFHGNSIGGNLGLTGNYTYNVNTNMQFQTAYFQVSGELTILPIRLGIKAGGHIGYAWGQMMNTVVMADNGVLVNDPAFQTLLVGFDAKARIYLSRFIAFTGYFGADYTLSPQFETNFWNTMFRFGVGIDFIIPVRQT